MTEGEYLAFAIIGLFFLALIGLAGVIGAWTIKNRRTKKHQAAFFADLDKKREHRKKQFKENMGRRYGS